MKQISGNKLLVKALKEEGVEYHIFGYPGACTIDISDDPKQDVKSSPSRTGPCPRSDAYARTTGKVGVCLVTSGPEHQPCNRTCNRQL